MIPRLHSFYPKVLPEIEKVTLFPLEEQDEEEMLAQEEQRYNLWESSIRYIWIKKDSSNLLKECES